MKAILRKTAGVKKRQTLKRAVTALVFGWGFKYGQLSKTDDVLVDCGQQNQHLEAKYSNQKPVMVDVDEQSFPESQSVNYDYIRVKTGSGIISIRRKNFQNEIPDYLKEALQLRAGELGKSGPEPRAKADALKNAKKTGGGSIFAQSFTTQRQYCSRPSTKPLSCRNHAKLKNNPFHNSQVKKNEVAKLSESVTKSYSEIKHELEIKQHQKTIKIGVAGKTYMIENADRMGVDQLENKLAEQMYNSIRDNHKDISDIAGNLGFKADNIKNVKDHVFYNEHVLDRYAHLGDDPVVQRFDPDLKQALAWKRLETGTHTQDDVTWMKHECAERHHELKYGSGYTESHDRAQSRFDGNPWNDD